MKRAVPADRLSVCSRRRKRSFANSSIFLTRAKPQHITFANIRGQRIAIPPVRPRTAASHRPHATVAGPLRAAWSRPKQTDLVSGKRQFRSRFHHPLSYGCPTTIFRDPRNRHRHHLSATLLDGRAGNGWARLLRRGRDRSGGRFPNAGYEPHPSCGDCPLTANHEPRTEPEFCRGRLANLILSASRCGCKRSASSP
jgi:hypothetical protein